MKSFGNTDRGLVRELNEDDLYYSAGQVGALPNLYIIADGMGGHNAGEVASRNCIRYLVEYIAEADFDEDIEQLFYDAIAYTNDKVYREGQENDNMHGMGTTMVISTIYKDIVYVANVGDSRLYTIGKEFEQVTVDHSVVEELYRAGHITEVEKNHHPNRNMITRAIGVEGDVHADFFAVRTDALTHVLICTDGLTKMVTDLELGGLFNRGYDLEELVNALNQTALDHGGDDNITIILVDLESGEQQ